MLLFTFDIVQFLLFQNYRICTGWLKHSLIPYKRFVISLKEYGWKAVMVIDLADTRRVTGTSFCGGGGNRDAVSA